MPLVVLAGQPCSGKSRVADALLRLLSAAGHAALLVDEPSLHLERNTAYQTSAQEKATRGALKSAVERAVSKRTVVILDSLNNIKGYRYELWCVARAAGTRYCVVHVATPADTCAGWNEARPQAERYTHAIFQDLAGRFEVPESRNRWDSPLFTLHPGGPEEASVLAAVAAAMTGTALPRPAEPPGQDQAPTQQLAGGDGGPAALAGPPAAALDLEQQQQLAHKAAQAGQLQPTMATTNAALLATNLLHELDQAVQEVVSRIVEVQQLAPDAGASGSLVALGAAGQLQLCRHVSLAELRRHKRGFLKLATKITSNRLQDPAAAQRMFVDHLRLQLAQPAA